MEPHETVYKKYVVTYDMSSDNRDEFLRKIKEYKNFHFQNSVYLIESLDDINTVFEDFLTIIDKKKDKLYIFKTSNINKEWKHYDPDKQVMIAFNEFMIQ